MYIYPETVPTFEIGEGRIHYEGAQGIVDSPHAQMKIEKLHLDFYSMVRERYVRLFSVTIDFEIGLFLELTPDNKLLPMSNDLKNSMRNVKVTNVEMLSEDTSSLEKTLPSLIDFALPIITSVMLQAFPLPDPQIVPGYNFKVDGLRGMNLIAGSNPARYEYLSAFGSLERAPVRPTGPGREVAREAPEATMEVVPAASESRVTLNMRSDVGDDVEYAYRLNGGIYSTFQQGSTLEIERAQLRIEGPHKIEVLARRVSDRRLLSQALVAQFSMPKAVAMSTQEQGDLSTRAGCNSSGGTPSLLALMLLSGLVARRRKESHS